jgi:hypothetical protein
MELSRTNTPLRTEVFQPSPLPNPDYSSQCWHAAYMAALFETDRRQMANRITEARHLILRREHELVCGSSDRAELNALNRAMHALQALRTCLGL